MYAYIDETGNTGSNLFDPNQPVFMTAALITKTNFDLLYKNNVRMICKKLGVAALHANELGIWKIEEVASDILRIIKKSDARIFISRIAKIDLAATKFFDTIFDSGENLAVPWHTYNVRALRLFLTIKVAYLLDEPLLKLFWNSLMERQKDRAYEILREVLIEFLPRATALPDERSRSLVTEAVQWAIDNPEAIHLHINARIHRHGHLPNIAAFPELLNGIEVFSKKWGRQVREIVHDRQSQFGETLKMWHEILSNASPEPLALFVNEKYVIRRTYQSKFTISSTEDNAGLQIIDIILWLFKQVHDGKPIPSDCAKLLDYMLGKSLFYDLSLERISNSLSNFFTEIDQAPLSPEQLSKANELLKDVEESRQEKMRAYCEQKTIISKTSDK